MTNLQFFVTKEFPKDEAICMIEVIDSFDCCYIATERDSRFEPKSQFKSKKVRSIEKKNENDKSFLFQYIYLLRQKKTNFPKYHSFIEMTYLAYGAE